MLRDVLTSGSFRRWRLFAAAGLLLTLAACSLAFQTKEERQQQLQQQLAAGEMAWKVRDFEVARRAYESAHSLDPADRLVILRLGAIHEFLGRYAEAAAVYRGALKGKDLSGELEHDLIFRLALLEAFHLDGGENLPSLLAKLPPSSPYAYDLRAVLALLSGDGRKALLELNLARALPLSQEMSSIILYHAARAYTLTGDVDRAMLCLYEAINRAEYSSVSKDISEFREFLLEQPQS